jgi:asparagine synthase (glutamine-hydrolysing)
VPAPRAIETGQAVEEFRELFTDCVSRRLLSDVPLGAFLSGGIDSASVVATMADLSDRPVETFSIGFGEQTFDELPGARLVADRYRTNHHEFVVEPRAAEVLPLLARHYGEPYADSSALPTYYLAQVTRQHVTVALNGDGGDELLAGYDRYRAAAMLDRVETLLPLTGGAARAVATRLPDGRDLRSPISRARRFLTGFAEPAGARYSRWMSQFQPERLDQCISDELRLAWQGSGAPDYLAAPIDRRNGTGIVDTLTRLDQSTYLPEDLLVKVDIASMANSLEARSPFLDYRLFEWAATLPTSLRLNGEVSKYVLRLAMAEKLPPSTLRGPKRGFGVPVASWLRTDLRPLLEDAVLAPRALQRGYFHPGELRRLVAEHVTGRADHSKPLWALLMLELWHQQLADRPASAAVAV